MLWRGRLTNFLSIYFTADCSSVCILSALLAADFQPTDDPQQLTYFPHTFLEIHGIGWSGEKTYSDNGNILNRQDQLFVLVSYVLIDCALFITLVITKGRITIV